MKKKICFIATISKTIEWFMLDQAEFFSKNGFDVYIICDEDHEFSGIIPEKITFLPVSMKRGIDFSAIKSIYSMYKIFRKYKFDIIQYTTPNASMYASIAGFLSGIPVRIYRQWGMVYLGFNGVKRAIFKAIEKCICNFSTFILPDSFGNLDFCRSEGFYKKNKSDVILNGSAAGIDFVRFDVSKKNEWRKEIRAKYNIGDNDFVFGFIGRINRDKGINELISAFKSFLNIDNSAKLFLVGLADREDEITHDLLDWAKNCDNIFFTGVTSEAEKFYASFDVFILPSYREGFGSTLIEAQAMEIPVITTNIPGPSEAIIDGKTGILVEVKNTDELFSAMTKLYNDPALRIEYGKNGLEHTNENFDRNKLFEKNLEFINNLSDH